MTDKTAPRPQAGATEIPIILDGEEVVLRPNYGAARAISNKFGGVGPAIERVLKLDVEAIAEIIAYGLGYHSPTKRADRDLPERVWRTGLTDEQGGLAELCIIFLHAISNRGRVPARYSDDPQAAEAEEDAQADPQ